MTTLSAEVTGHKDGSRVVQRAMPMDKKPVDGKWTLLRQQIADLPISKHSKEDQALETNHTVRQIYCAIRGTKLKITTRTLSSNGKVLVWRRA